MRISELSRRTGVPVGTIKYYLREGLLPSGELTSATQASYGDRHLERLELIRVLIGTGGLSIAAVRAVVSALDRPPESGHDLLGTAHAAIGPPVTVDAESLERTRRMVAGWGWVGLHDAPAMAQLAAALDGIRLAGIELPEAELRRYAELMAQVGELDVASVPVGSAAEMIRYVVAGTVLFEPMLLALRKLAHWDASARRFGPAPPPEVPAARG